MIAVLALAMSLAACGGGTATTADSSEVPDGFGSSSVAGENGPGDELPYGLRRCDPDAPRLAADPGLYRDQPVYVANEQPVEEVRSWAVTRPGFEEIWLDRDRNGWITVGFSEQAEARQAELESEFPDVGVVAVGVPVTNSELEALRAEVQAALEGLSSWGLSHSVSRGMVEVTVPVLDEATLGRLAPLAGPTLCVEGTDPADAVPDGPQPTGGDGWRLLGTERTGSTYRTGVATTPGQYDDLWRQAGLAEDAPPVDFESEIVVWFGAVYGSSCPIRLDDVVVDTERRVVHGAFVNPGNPTSCNDDANPEAYVVTVARDRLPEAPFAVQLDSEDPPAGAPEERTTVEVDLRPAGSTASVDDLVVEGLDRGPTSQLEPFAPGLVIENGFPWATLLDLTCSVDVLGPLNSTMWQATDPELSGGPPAAWSRAASNGFAEAELLLTTDPARLTVTINGTSVDYEPAPISERAAMVCR